jgi:hypothetical protein
MSEATQHRAGERADRGERRCEAEAGTHGHRGAGSAQRAARKLVSPTRVCVAVAAAVLMVSACGGSRISHATAHRRSHATAPGSPRSLPPGLTVPTSYQEACADEAVCVQSAGAYGDVPRALNRPLHFPVVKRRARCPATPGAPISTPYVAGVALGDGPVRALPASAGDLRHGIVDLDPASVPGWREIKTIWISSPDYQGPFVIRAERLNGPGPIVLGGSGALPTPVMPLVVPPGPTLNGGGGWRTVPSGTWARSPGCYAWQIDGLNFSEVIVFDARWFRFKR